VQYRGEILPLIDLSRCFGQHGQNDGESLQVVVHSDSGGSVGFVVEAIDDIVDGTMSARRRGGRRGVLGSAVIQGRVTELLDVEAIRKSGSSR
jgi:two-component system chemotaxis sensor kinase CheA